MTQRHTHHREKLCQVTVKTLSKTAPDAMGSLGCPLCCQQDFGSVGALWDHLIYYIYRPLQCGVCCRHLEGIQEFMHHIKCHLGDGLPTNTKLSCSKPPLTTGGESSVQSSPPPTCTTAQDTAAADPDAGIGSAQLSDGFSNYMKGSDAANQLLKLREWQLEKWGKNFSKHRASFAKSPGVLELSPASARTHRGSPPVGAKELMRDRRPSSQISCCTPRSDVPSLGRSIGSVERFDTSATPLSVYGNVSSVDVSDQNVCPQSVGKEVSELDFHSPAQPGSPLHGGTHSLPSQQAVSSRLKPMPLTSPKPDLTSSPVLLTATELLPDNVDILSCVPAHSNVSCHVDLNQQPRSVASPLLYVLSAQEVASCSLPPSRNDLQDLHEYTGCAAEFVKHSSESPVAQNNAINNESCESSDDKLPLLETVDSDEFGANVCSPTKQYHELQSVTNKEQLQSVLDQRGQTQLLTTNDEHHLLTVNEPLQAVTINREHQSVTVNEPLQAVTLNKEHQSVLVNEKQLQPVTVNKPQSVRVNKQPQPVTVNRELLQSPSNGREQSQSVTCVGEDRQCEAVSGIPDIWVSCASTSATATHKSPEISNRLPQQDGSDSYMLVDSHLSGIHDNLNTKHPAYNYWSSIYNEEGTFQREIMDSMTKSASSDDMNPDGADALKGLKSSAHFHDEGNTSTFQCSEYGGHGAQEPYLHKKFHHDQERKVLPTAGVDQVADVSQYINSFQSVLVRKLNGTLSSAIPMTSNICSVSMKKPEKERNQEVIEQLQQAQAIEHTCDVCHQKFTNVSTFKLHFNEHKKEGEDTCMKNLYRECPKDPPEKKCRKESFHCDQCSKVYRNAFNFARHMREVHAVKKSFICMQCNKAFSSKRHLQEHSGIHKVEKAHECPQCHHLCYTASGLRTHIQEIHSTSEQRDYSCDICKEKFAKVYGLKRHKQRKHTKQQLACQICSKTFLCQEDMNKHSRTHVGMATLKCDTCDKTFSTSWALQRHLETHQNSKNFTCSICNFSFTRKDSLLSHLNAHSQKKPHVCHCGKRFVKKSQLKEHQDKHSSVPKYSCSVCKHSFKFKVSLKNHSCKKKEVIKIID